jgi:hypothetical protein
MLDPDDVKEALVAPNSRDKDLIPDQGIRNLDPEKRRSGDARDERGSGDSEEKSVIQKKTQRRSKISTKSRSSPAIEEASG